MSHRLRNKHGRFQSREQYDRNIKRNVKVFLTSALVYVSMVMMFGVDQYTITRAQADDGEHVEVTEPALPSAVDIALATIPHKTEETAKRIRYLYENAPSDVADVIAKTIYCESMWQSVQSAIPGEQSFGLAQIHLPSHPHITKEQAMDAYFAIDFAIKTYELDHWYGYDRKNDRCTNGLQKYW